MTEGATSLCVLVVEDEMFVRMTTVDMLEDLGHTAIEADCARTALELLTHNAAINLLLTDVGLPDMRGPALAKACLELRPGLPVIFATGYDSRSVVDEFESGGLMGVLNKPFQLRDLETVLSTTLRRLPD
ncbi:response regulator [Chelatococcus reniformis]|uniref:Response regulator n=1 Tax=Chelatococcus reniformis TaxID=1494448 RepID=A0A916UTP4_9HYPH|nr:response regulator [Chelatococcus reniformis]GGC84485.1 response regulator [Chelatococcus reniformis]